MRAPGRIRAGSSLPASALRRIQRWPGRSYFAELQPQAAIAHPVDQVIDGLPEVRRATHRARDLLARVQRQAKPEDVLEFEAARNAAEWAKVEAAFNIGFEAGFVLGRAEGLRRTIRGVRRSRDEDVLLRRIRSALAQSAIGPGKIELLLLELAYSHAAGPSAPQKV